MDAPRPAREPAPAGARPAPAAVAPLWASAFRPFYLIGSLYAPLLALGGAGAWLGWVDLPGAGLALPLWHGHEMVFGFVVAIVVGTLLTALPSWAGLPEIRGTPLALLAALWLLGRVAFWAAPWLPLPLVMAADALLLPVLAALLAAPLWRAPNRLYRLLLPILLALVASNLAYHAALLMADTALAERALRGAVWALVVLYSLKGGLLTPVFTGNALRASARGEPAPFSMPLEALALALLIAAAAADLAGAAPRASGIVAAACALVHAVRVARWRGWRVADAPLLPSMHLGFAWLVAALALKAAADLGAPLPATAWVHAFTVGALGLMMIGLMTRVALRHTGRPLVAPSLIRLAAPALFAAAALRLAASAYGLGAGAMALAALLWAAAFAAWGARFAAVLVGPSLPRGR